MKNKIKRLFQRFRKDGIYFEQRIEGESVKVSADWDCDLPQVCAAFQRFLHDAGFSKKVRVSFHYAEAPCADTSSDLVRKLIREASCDPVN